MKTSALKPNFYMFGNWGAVWSKKAHIAESGSFSGTTLCGVPMLSSNHCQNEKVEDIGCPECLTAYEKLNKESTLIEHKKP